HEANLAEVRCREKEKSQFRLSIHYPAKQPKAKGNSDTNPQTPNSHMFYCESQLVLVGWRPKSCHECDEAENNEDDGDEHNENGVLGWRRFSRWKNPKHRTYVAQPEVG